MKRVHQRSAMWCLAAALLGALGYALLGPSPPGSLADERQDELERWELPAPHGVAGAPGVAAWEDVDPWGIGAAAPVADAPPSPPPAIPVGIVRQAGRWEAVFLQDGAEQRVGPGERLQGGGQVRSVDALEVQWVDAKGNEHSRKLLSDPLPVSDAPDPAAAETIEDRSSR